MSYQSIIRNEQGRLKLPFAGLPMVLNFTGIRLSAEERPALENMTQFVSTMMILAGRLKSSLARYEENTWVNVPFHVLFVDTQSVVLFLRQFMEDASFIIRTVLPNAVRSQMPAGFTDLAVRIRNSGPDRDPELAKLCEIGDPLRQFLVLEERWLREIKDLRDDICHRSAYGRLRSATFPGFMELIRAGGGKAPFASEADLRSYLCALFERWLAFANIVGEFAARRVCEDYPEHRFSLTGGFVVADGEIDVTTSPPEPLFRLGTTIMTVAPEGLASLEYFLRAA
jgi:hypothetical protein